MDLKILALVFNFVLICWPKTNLITRIKQLYGHNTLTLFRKLENTFLKLKKIELDINFIKQCQSFGLIPTFCRIKLVNQCNLSTKDLHRLQNDILSLELRHKLKTRATLFRTYNHGLLHFKSKVSFITYISVLSFLRNSAKSQSGKVSLRHARKLGHLKHRHRFTISTTDDNPNVVVNLSSYKLTDSEIMLLSRGLNFSVPPHHLDRFDIMTSFECLYRQFPYVSSTSGNNRLKHRLKNLCYAYIYGYDPKSELNLTNSELTAYKNLSSEMNLSLFANLTKDMEWSS